MTCAQQLQFENYPDDSYRYDYDRSREYMIERVARYPGVVALYEYGVVGAPGLSDLDFIVVLSDNLPGTDLSDLIFMQDVPSYVGKTLDGSILRSMSQTQFSKVQLLGNIKTRLLWGDRVTHEPLSEADKIWVKIADVMDWLPERVLMLRDYATMEVIPVKRLVGCLHSFQHSMQRAFDIDPSFKGERLMSFQNRLGLLRQTWFDANQSHNRTELSELMYEGITIGSRLMVDFGRFLLSKGYYPQDDLEPGGIFYLNPRKWYRFSSLSESVHIERIACGGLFVDVPTVWYSHLENLAVKLILKTGRMDPALKHILDARIQLCNDMAAYLQQAGLGQALYRFAHIKPVLEQDEG
jgi:hypothetical protein